MASTAPEHEAGPRVSVIIPAWGDSVSLAAILPTLEALPLHEIIVVDVCADTADCRLPGGGRARLICTCSPSRGRQMNLGAAAAEGDVLVFQHADTLFSREHLSALKAALRDNASIIGGAFHRRFDGRHPRLRWLEKVARFLSRHGGTLFGDQTVFVRREVFQRLHGFAEIPLMEDVEFSRRLRAAGRVVVLDPPVETSPRHHQENGAWRTSIRNGLFLLLFRLGVSAERLHAWYYRRPRPDVGAAPVGA